jgi:hypothetical protein
MSFGGSGKKGKDNGLVQQPGWLFHKSRRFGVFFAKIHQIYPFLAEVVQ